MLRCASSANPMCSQPCERACSVLALASRERAIEPAGNATVESPRLCEEPTRRPGGIAEGLPGMVTSPRDDQAHGNVHAVVFPSVRSEESDILRLNTEREFPERNRS